MSFSGKRFKWKLILSLGVISILGIFVVQTLGNTIVREIYYHEAIHQIGVIDNVTANVWSISIFFAIILLTINIITLLVISFLTRNMEERETTEERLREILNASPLACWFMDEKLKVTELNPAARKLFALEEKEKVLEHFSVLSPEHQPDGRHSMNWVHELLKSGMEGNTLHFEWMHHTKDGKEQIPCEINTTRIKVRNKHHMICFARDLREVRKSVAMVHRLQKEVYTDSLTGAMNRRFFDEDVPKEIEICNLDKKPYSLLLFDVDFFKKVNDEYGHQVGDEVLKILVARTRASVKKDTVVARIGGEEFAISLPGATKEDAMKVAQRVRLAVGEKPFKVNERTIPITISIGVTTCNKASLPLEIFTSQADEALYKAKHTGRNKAVFYEV